METEAFLRKLNSLEQYHLTDLEAALIRSRRKLQNENSEKRLGSNTKGEV